jgi:hypothetical protein
MSKRFSGESFVWSSTIVLVFVSCGASLFGPDQNSANETLVSGGLVIDDIGDNPVLAQSVVGIFPRAAAQGSQGLADIESALMCTGVVISEQLVLTAAHCFEGLGASSAAVYFPFATEGERSALVQGLEIHPSYDPRLPTDPTNVIPPSDLALLRLDRSIPAGYKPALVSEFDATKASNQGLPARFLVSGYGVTFSRNNRDGGKLRSATINLQQTDPKRYVIETFGGTRSAPVGGCAGDSGAPLMELGQPAGRVLGVLSTGGEIAGRCVGTNSFTDLRYYSAWLRSTASSQGQTIGFFVPQSEKWNSISVAGVRVDSESFRHALKSGSVLLPFSINRVESGTKGTDRAALQDAALALAAKCQIELRMEYTLPRASGETKAVSRWRSPLFQFGGRAGISFSVPAPVVLPKDLVVIPSMTCDGGYVKVEPKEMSVN